MPGTDRVIKEVKFEKFCKLISTTLQMHLSEPKLGLGIFHFAFRSIEIYIGNNSQATWAYLLFLVSR